MENPVSEDEGNTAHKRVEVLSKLRCSMYFAGKKEYIFVYA
jgi:hypothetical protein